MGALKANSVHYEQKIQVTVGYDFTSFHKNVIVLKTEDHSVSSSLFYKLVVDFKQESVLAMTCCFTRFYYILILIV